jgi:RES domain-containing protein
MLAYRLSKKKYAGQLSGIGASRFGGRWNSPGTEVIYTAENRSLALAEIVVHLKADMISQNFMMLTIYLPDTLPFETHTIEQERWNLFPALEHTRVVGDRFVKFETSLALRVPSVVTKGDYNLLINPHHSDFNKVNIIDREPFKLDRRFF